MSDLYLKLVFDINNGEFDVDTNIKSDKINDIVADFLRTQMGAGVDKSEANKLDKYKIILKVDLSDDSFRVTHNCGNLGLRDGILMEFLRKNRT